MQYCLYDRYTESGTYDRSIIDVSGRRDSKPVKTVQSNNWIEAKQALGIELTAVQALMLLKLQGANV